MSETIDWNPFGQKTIRKCTLYSPMCWRTAIDFTKNVACISQYGGLIATAWDESQGSRSPGNRPDVTIYNAAGKEISSLRWNSGILIGIGWTRSDELLCLQEDGQVLIYDVFMQFQRSFTMGMECRENKVMEYEVFASQHGTGLAVMNGLYRFLIVNNVDDPKVRILADVPGLRSTPPSSWCVLPSSRSSKVLAANDSDIYLLDQGGLCSQHTPTDLNATPSSYIAMAVSVDGKHLVLFMNTGTLWMGSSDFQEKYCEFNTNIGSRPKQLLWLCNSVAGSSAKLSERDVAVVVYWPKMLLVVGPKKDWIRYAVEEDIHTDSGLGSAVLSADVDGVRIVTANRHEFLQHVPSAVESIFKIGSMSPGSLLKCAAQEYSHESEKADEYLRMLLDNGQLPEAVEKCITAASAEFQPRLQKTLLSAASFGKSFAPSLHLTEMFVDTCQMLRILNAVRDFNIGISLTAAQFQSLTTHCLIDRLVHRRQFQLAFHICKYLKTPEDQGSSRILSHWACYKVQQTDVDDESIVRAIKQKLRSASGVSYADIAEKAVECGRKDLAIKLLDLERRASEQIRLLSKLGKHTLALEKAVLSGNTDLVYEAIARLRERSSLSDFLVAIRQQPVAYKLYLKNCREQNERMLKDLHEQEDNFIELAHCHIQDSLGTFRAEERVTSLHSAMDNFNKARDEFSAKVIEEQLQLLREQTALEQETDSSFVELSLHDTLHALLITGQLKRAEQLRKQQKINDKRWWWLRIQALAEQGNFIELESFSKSKKSPIGYLPFIEVCMKHNAPSEVAKYISKVAQEKRVSALLKAGNVRAAADLALQSKNVIDLDMVLKRCGTEHREVSDQVQSAIIQLQRR